MCSRLDPLLPPFPQVFEACDEIVDGRVDLRPWREIIRSKDNVEAVHDIKKVGKRARLLSRVSKLTP